MTEQKKMRASLLYAFLLSNSILINPRHHVAGGEGSTKLKAAYNSAISLDNSSHNSERAAFCTEDSLRKTPQITLETENLTKFVFFISNGLSEKEFWHAEASLIQNSISNMDQFQNSCTTRDTSKDSLLGSPYSSNHETFCYQAESYKKQQWPPIFDKLIAPTFQPFTKTQVSELNDIQKYFDSYEQYESLKRFVCLQAETFTSILRMKYLEAKAWVACTPKNLNGAFAFIKDSFGSVGQMKHVLNTAFRRAIKGVITSYRTVIESFHIAEEFIVSICCGSADSSSEKSTDYGKFPKELLLSDYYTSTPIVEKGEKVASSFETSHGLYAAYNLIEDMAETSSYNNTDSSPPVYNKNFLRGQSYQHMSNRDALNMAHSPRRDATPDAFYGGSGFHNRPAAKLRALNAQGGKKEGVLSGLLSSLFEMFNSLFGEQSQNTLNGMFPFSLQDVPVYTDPRGLGGYVPAEQGFYIPSIEFPSVLPYPSNPSYLPTPTQTPRSLFYFHGSNPYSLSSPFISSPFFSSSLPPSQFPAEIVRYLQSLYSPFQLYPESTQGYGTDYPNSYVPPYSAPRPSFYNSRDRYLKEISSIPYYETPIGDSVLESLIHFTLNSLNALLVPSEAEGGLENEASFVDYLRQSIERIINFVNRNETMNSFDILQQQNALINSYFNISEFQREMLDLHNTYRTHAYIQSLVWDPSLLYYIRNHLKFLDAELGCALYHSSKQQRQHVGPFFNLGENLYSIWETLESPDAMRITKGWYGEIGCFSYGPLGDPCTIRPTSECIQNLNASRYTTAHFTQMMWSGLTHMACDERKCTSYDGIGSKYIVGCAYGSLGSDGGNIAGQLPFSSVSASLLGLHPVPCQM